jgi:hypothetical protein
MQYQTDYVLRTIEQMALLISRALEVFRHDGDPELPVEMTQEALGLVVGMDPDVFVRLDPQSMASLLEMSAVDDRCVALVAEALEAQAAILEETGSIVDADARRQQAAAVMGLLGPMHGN